MAAIALGCQSAPEPPLSVNLAADLPLPIAQLEFKIGGVLLERGKEPQPAELGYLFAKDVVETQEDGRARVRFPGERFLEIEPHARITIGEDKGSLLLRILRGGLSVRVASAAAGPLDFWGEQGGKSWMGIQTPYGVVRLAPGRNELSIALVSDSAQVQALGGAVEVVSRGGTATRLAEGQQLTLTLGK